LRRSAASISLLSSLCVPVLLPYLFAIFTCLLAEVACYYLSCLYLLALKRKRSKACFLVHR
jgi:hypothetical protein